MTEKSSVAVRQLQIVTFSYFECMKSKHILNLFERFSGVYINYFVIFITFTAHLSSGTTQHISLLRAICFVFSIGHYVQLVMFMYHGYRVICINYIPTNLLLRRIDFSPSVNCQRFFRYWWSLKSHSSIQNWNFDWREFVHAGLLHIIMVLWVKEYSCHIIYRETFYSTPHIPWLFLSFLKWCSQSCWGGG